MPALVMQTVMDTLATSIRTAGFVKNVYAYPVEQVNIPCAVIGYPDEITFDDTFGRGSDKASLPIYFVIGRTATKSARDTLSDAISAMKLAVDNGVTRVESARIEWITVGSIDYIAAVFTVSIET